MGNIEKIYNTKIIRSGNRLEIYKFNNYAVRAGSTLERYSEEAPEEKENIDKAANRKKVMQRGKNNIIRLLQSNSDMTTFLTLTFAKERNYKNSKKDLNNFFNKLRRYKKDLKYLWVMEYGSKRKRLHFHVLTNLFSSTGINLKVDGFKTDTHKDFENKFMRKFWSAGFVDIRSLNEEDNINVALYVSKYITKAMEDVSMEGYRIYGYSHKTLEKPVETKYYSKETIEDLIRSFPSYKIKYQSSYTVGFTDYKGERKGVVTYLDLELKGV